MSPPNTSNAATPSNWEQAWERAQPHLERLRSSAPVTARSLRPAIARVSQLDSELLDQELVHILQEPLNRTIASLKPSLRTRFSPELTLLIQSILYRGSIWNLGSSYGAALQGLKYSVSKKRRRGPLAPCGLPRKILLIHAVFTVLVPYLHTRLRNHALSQAWPDAPLSDKRRKAWELLANLEALHTQLGLVNFVAFLWNGRYRTLSDYLVGMRLVLSNNSLNRNVSYEFMNRQMVWHAFTEFLIFLLPLIYPRLIRRSILRAWSSIKSIVSPNYTKGPSVKQKGPYWLLSSDQCAICAENASYSLNLSNPMNAFSPISQPVVSIESDSESPTFPIHMPYIASCGDVYCYHCIVEKLMKASTSDDDGLWKCIRCGELVKAADRMGADEYGTGAASDISGSMSEYDFSSDMDVGTDLSTSFTYTGSERSDE